MAISDFVRSWTGQVCRHIPDDSPYGVLDTRFAGGGRRNRWNHLGEPTYYLAGDRAVLVSEFGRHLDDDNALRTRTLPHLRRIYDIRIEIERLIDLRDPRVCSELALEHAPACFLDRELARATAGYLRRATKVQAIIAPSAAFLDDLDRWVLVVFLETLDGGLESIVRSVTRDGVVRYDP